jgi:hypothetical protein
MAIFRKIKNQPYEIQIQPYACVVYAVYLLQECADGFHSFSLYQAIYTPLVLLELQNVLGLFTSYPWGGSPPMLPTSRPGGGTATRGRLAAAAATAAPRPSLVLSAALGGGLRLATELSLHLVGAHPTQVVSREYFCIAKTTLHFHFPKKLQI